MQGAAHSSSSRGRPPSRGFRTPPSLPLSSRTSARQGAVPSLLSREFLGPRLPVPSCPDVAAAPQLSAAGGSAQRGAARFHHGLRQRHRGVLRRSRRCSPGGRLPRAVSPVRPPPCPPSALGEAAAPPSAHSGCWGSAVGRWGGEPKPRGCGDTGRLAGLVLLLLRWGETSLPRAGRIRVWEGCAAVRSVLMAQILL